MAQKTLEKILSTNRTAPELLELVANGTGLAMTVCIDTFPEVLAFAEEEFPAVEELKATIPQLCANFNSPFAKAGLNVPPQAVQFVISAVPTTEHLE